jgi:hypothetical protein
VGWWGGGLGGGGGGVGGGGGWGVGGGGGGGGGRWLCCRLRLHCAVEIAYRMMAVLVVLLVTHETSRSSARCLYIHRTMRGHCALWFWLCVVYLQNHHRKRKKHKMALVYAACVFYV